MCVGIGIVVVVPEDGPMQFFGRTGNSSHDTILHEMVPIELHNRVAKVEYTYPHALRLDAPDEVCRRAALDLGVAETGPFGLQLKTGVVEAIQRWVGTGGIAFTASTLQKADLQGANLWEADLQGANLQGADLQGANLQGADLEGTIGLEGGSEEGRNREY